jgi:putative peptide zinc metalloprotease protein
MNNTIYRLNPHLYIQELDTGTEDRKFYVEVNQSSQYEINESLYALLELINGKRTVSEITQLYNDKYQKQYEEKDIVHLIQQYLIPKGILFEVGQLTSPINQEKKQSYINFKVSLIKTDYLEKITNITSFLFRTSIFLPMLFISLIAQVTYYCFVMQPSYITLDFLFSKQVILFYLAMNISTVLHEIGHASAMKSRNLNHGVVGAGIYLFMLVFYTDVSRVWRLKRKDRLVVNFGGIYFELLWTMILLMLYFVFHHTLFLLIIFFIHMRIVWNLIPFFRTDGYWIFSDLTGVTNLRKISSSILLILAKKLFVSSTRLPREFTVYPITRRIMIIIYAVTSNAFFILIGYWLLKYSRKIIMNFNSEIIEPIRQMFMTSDFSYLYITDFLRIFFKILLLLFVCYYIYRISVEGYQKLKGIFSNG